MSIQLSNIPSELKEVDQWVCWKKETRDGRETKIPYQVNGSRADSTDRSTWSSFEDVCNVLERGSCDGIGFVFSEDDLFVGVDLDDCVKDGELSVAAKQMVREIGSYAEFSPSRTGIHIILKGMLPGDRRRTSDVPGMKELEIYEDARYFTMTGWMLEDASDSVCESPQELKQIYEWAFVDDEDEEEEPSSPKPVRDVDDRDLIEKAKSADNGDKFQQLWGGDTTGYESHSEADAALASLLAFWTGGDRQRIERLMSKSGLSRDKWKNRPDYRKRTIDKALEGRTEFYDPDHRSTKTKRSPREAPPEHNGQPTGPTRTGWDKVNYLYKQNEKREARLEAAMKVHEDLTIATHEESGRMYIWDRDEKIFTEGAETKIETILWDKIGKWHSPHEVKDIKAKIRALTYRDDFDSQTFIPVANGDLDPNTFELHDVSPEDRPFRGRSEASWETDTHTPIFDTYLKRAVPDEHERQTLQEYLGYCLMHWKLPFHKALFVVGPTASGKSTFLSLCRMIIGKTTSIRPKQLVDDRFGAVRLESSWANIRSDISSALLKDIGLFKEITAGDKIFVERKYEQGYPIEPKAKHLYSANRLPDVALDDDAFYRRILLVSFPETVPQEDRDRELLDKLTLELPGILRWAVEGLSRIRDRGQFTHDLSPKETRRRWEGRSSSIGRFKSARLQVTGNHEDHYVQKSDVYSAYSQFCEDEGLATETQKKLTSALKRDPHIDDGRRRIGIDGNREYVYEGVQLLDSDGNVVPQEGDDQEGDDEAPF